jgi:tRNA threonylcarbamoyladenosine biosynthesis protein TsaE
LNNIIKKISNNTLETLEIGKWFAGNLQPGAIVCLSGNLGSGKTTISRGICIGLGVTDYVTSPTFTLINEYKGRLPVYHFDFYRIQSPLELYELGLDEYFNGDGVCLIEWPEIVMQEITGKKYEIHITWNLESGLENQREIVITEYLKNGQERP